MKKAHAAAAAFLSVSLFVCLFLGDSITLFTLAYVCVFFYVSLRALSAAGSHWQKLLFVLTYASLMVVQIVFAATIVIPARGAPVPFSFLKIFAIFMALAPFAVERLIIIRKTNQYYMPKIGELPIVSFAQLMEDKDRILDAVRTCRNAGRVISKGNLTQILADMHRHRFFSYISGGRLTEHYFNQAEKSLGDGYLYLILSNTGSPASEMISLVTGTSYNHISLSFDPGLETIISYNAGEKIHPPGLNHELVEYLTKKPDASILVYRLEASRACKERILDQIRKINEEGSAYNLAGLFVKRPLLPNIMYCSQFVYRMLKCGGLAYFDVQDKRVRPSDFVERDYFRKLQFFTEIRLGGNALSPAGE